MVWLLERNKDLLLCEIRQPFGSSEYEFEVAPRGRTGGDHALI